MEKHRAMEYVLSVRRIVVITEKFTLHLHVCRHEQKEKVEL
jgi:hypothetical protein